MKFSHLAQYFEKLETTSSRNMMTEILADLFKNAGKEEIQSIVYLIQARVAPLYEPIEFGIADRMMIQVLARAYGKETSEISKQFGIIGDLGAVGEKIERISLKLFENEKKELTVNEVFEELKRLAMVSGGGSVDTKINILSELIQNLDSLSVRYVIRIPLGKMRLGFSDMTILDALSWLVGKTKEHRSEIERAFNVRPDLGFIAKKIKNDGVGGVKTIGPEVGVPIMMARAERLTSAEDIIKQIGKCAIEPKIDGFRVAVHYKNIKTEKQKNIKKITLFSRNMEETTAMFPDLIAGVEKQVKAKEAIFEGEAIAYNPKTGKYLPFQETVQRKRKYDIEEVSKNVPLKLLCFDCLYVDGENLINKTYLERRKRLERIIDTRGINKNILINEMVIVDKPETLEKIFNEAIDRGFEGIMAKKIDGTYQAGARDWNWIKLKKSYQNKLEDTIDAVVMGYDYGQGKRTGFGIGGFLIGIYNSQSDSFKTIAKIGTGLTDEEWKTLKHRTKNIEQRTKPKNYDVNKAMECNVWVEPKMVVVIRADEITRSPVHTAKYALRFPRLVDFRDDKNPEDTTTVKEIEGMYGLQGKRTKE